MSFGTSFVINPQQNLVVGNSQFTVVQTGYHYFGESGGRRNQKIADTSKIKKLNIEITVDKAPAGKIYLCYYSELGETLNFPFDPKVSGVLEDTRVLRCIELKSSTKTTKETFVYSADDYDFLKNLSVGAALFVESPQVNSEISVRMWGSI